MKFLLPALAAALALSASPARAQQRLSGVTVGEMAPEVAMRGPDGDTLRLSALRGHLVLLDFWASWCGPCRRENPNVRKTYHTYKDSLFTNGKGFRVFSVSLDRTGGEAAWKRAIAQDGLDWPWQVSATDNGINTAANRYQVRFIPTNVLIDATGKIVALNLHGEDLDHALKALLEHDPAKIAAHKKLLAKEAKAAARKARKVRRHAKD